MFKESVLPTEERIFKFMFVIVARHVKVEITTKIFKRVTDFDRQYFFAIYQKVGFKNCDELVANFLMPNVQQLSTRMIIFAHSHHLSKQFNSSWFFLSFVGMTAAPSAN